MSKITMQDIADALGTSRVTVWKTFNHRAGVSDEMKEKILEKAHELGYDKFSSEQYLPEPSKAKTVSLVVSRPDSSIFWTNIIHRMAQELSLSNVNLMYTYVPTSCTSEYELPRVHGKRKEFLMFIITVPATAEAFTPSLHDARQIFNHRAGVSDEMKEKILEKALQKHWIV